MATATDNRSGTVTVLLIGDVFGRSGRRAMARYLPEVKQRYRPAVVIANGENAAAGIGVTTATAKELFAAGVDVLTSGNHIWRHPEIVDYLSFERRLLRPANYPSGAPGRGSAVYATSCGVRIGVINVLGRVFMDPVDCPFQEVDRLLQTMRMGRDADVIVVDFHAEATSEKVALAMHLDGRVSAVLGTHTHVPTADHRILPGGTGFQTDLGMTGCYDSVIGMRTDSVLPKFTTRIPRRFEPEVAEGALCGTVLTLDVQTGACRSIRPVRYGQTVSVAQ
jgi:metallophosphoesterase (TIGR00282 family)